MRLWGRVLRAAFSSNNKQPDCLIDAYGKAAKERDILIAEVGAWGNFFPPDKVSDKKHSNM